MQDGDLQGELFEEPRALSPTEEELRAATSDLNADARRLEAHAWRLDKIAELTVELPETLALAILGALRAAAIDAAGPLGALAVKAAEKGVAAIASKVEDPPS